MKRCVKCILPGTYPGIKFSKNGICNFCLNYRPHPVLGIEALKERLEPYYNTTNKYHCVVGLSGGRDSSFVLYYVVKKLKLNPLAVTIDNGFIPQRIYENIDKAVRILGVDHIFIKQSATASTFATTLRAYIRKPHPALIGFLCNGCQSSIKKNLMLVAKKHKIKLLIGGGGDLIGGGGEPEQSFAEKLVIGKIKNKKLGLLLGSAKILLFNPEFLKSPRTLLSFLKEAYFRFVWSYKGVDVIGLFEYIGWDEKEIDDTIRKELGWEKPQEWPINWRSDCKIHWLKEFLYRETLGFNKNDELLSGMVRAGMISRDEALKRLEQANNLPIDYLKQFVSQFGVELTQLQDASRKWRERFNRPH